MLIRGLRSTGIGRVGAALALLVPVHPSIAEGPAEVRAVVVSATRSEVSEVSVPAAIQVITREDIEASGARNVGEALRGRGGVQVADTFGDGSRVSVSMRGFGETAHSNTLVLVDGRRLNNNDIANPDLNSVSLADVERIEIVHGSAGTLFGDQAVGGVVNIITRRPGRFRAEAEAHGGSFARRGVSASASQRLDNGLGYRVSVQQRASHNYRNHNATWLRGGFANVDWQHERGSVFAEIQHTDEDLETPGALFRAELDADRRQVPFALRNDYADTLTSTARVGVRHALTDYLSFEAEATKRVSDADFLLSLRTFPGAPGTQDRRMVGLTPRLIGAFPTADGELLLTVGHDLELFDYTLVSQLGFQRNEQKVRGTYAQAVVPLAPWLALTVGAREARVENDLRDSFTFPAGVTIDDTELLTEVGLSVRPAPGWRVFARRDENVRFAKVDEFTDPVPGTILRTQTGVSWELGAEWRGTRGEAAVTLYRLDLRNEIATVPGAGGFGLPANTNLPPTRRDGLIVSGAWNATERVRLSGDYGYVDGEVRSGPLAGKRVPFVAEHTVTLGARADLGHGFSLHAEAHAIGDRVLSGDFDNVLDTLPGYTVVNAQLGWRHGRWRLAGRVNNLLDQTYSDTGARVTLFPAPTFTATPTPSYFPAPERNFWLTAHYAFE